MDLKNHEIVLEGKYNTPAVLATFQKFYPTLKIQRNKKQIVLNTFEMSDDLINRLELDLNFFAKVPELPLENLCSRIDNYEPKNESQIELLSSAREFIDFKDFSKPTGLFVYGDPGVGKSHIAVAIAKEFTKRNYYPNYVQFSVNGVHITPSLAPNQIWFLDDLNNQYEHQLFTQVMLNVHNTGGKLFVASNMEYHELMKKMAELIGSTNAKRYFDRSKSLFKVLKVTGESYRQNTVWYNQ